MKKKSHRDTRRVVGFLNDVDRDASPLIEAPLLQDRANGSYWLDGTSPIRVDEEELRVAEEEGRVTWIAEQPTIEDGVILIAEDPTDVEKGRALPSLNKVYMSRRAAKDVLDRLAKAYLHWGLLELRRGDGNTDTTVDLLSRSFRCRRDSFGTLLLLWNVSRLARDYAGQVYELERVKEGTRRHLRHQVARDPARLMSLTRIQINCDRNITAIDFSEELHFEVPRSVDRAAVELLREVARFCTERRDWEPLRDLVLALDIQILLYSLLSQLPEVPSRVLEKVATLHLKEHSFEVEIVVAGDSNRWKVSSLFAVTKESKNLAAIELGGSLLGVASDATGFFKVPVWDALLVSADRDERGATQRLALASAFLEINGSLTDQPVNEIRNRSEVARAAEQLGRFQVVREQALEIAALATALETACWAYVERGAGQRSEADRGAADSQHKEKVGAAGAPALLGILRRLSRESSEGAQGQRLANAFESIADACRQLGNWELHHGNVEDAASWFDRGRQRFRSLLNGVDDSAFGRISERYAYCTLRLAEITLDGSLAKEAHDYYSKTVEWGRNRGKELPPRLLKDWESAKKALGLRSHHVGADDALLGRIDFDQERGIDSDSDSVAISPTRLRGELSDIRRRMQFDPRAAAAAAAELEDRVEHATVLKTYWIVARGFRLEALVRIGGTGQLRLAAELAHDLIRVADEADKGSFAESYACEQVAKYFQRIGDFRLADSWNRRLLNIVPHDAAALMRQDVLRAYLAATPVDIATARLALTSRARNETGDEAAQLWFSAGEVALLESRRWGVPGLADVETYYRKAVDTLSCPHPAAIHRLAWVQFLRGERLGALDTLERLPIDDTRAATLYSRIARSEGVDVCDRAMVRLAEAFAKFPHDRLLIRTLADTAASNWDRARGTCQRLIAEKVNNGEVAAGAALADALAARALFDDAIATTLIAHYERSGGLEAELAAYIHACMLRAANASDEDSVGMWANFFTALPTQLVLSLLEPTSQATIVRALNIYGTASSKAAPNLTTWPGEVIRAVESERRRATQWLDALKDLSSSVVERSLNGVDLSIVDSSQLGSSEFWRGSGVEPVTPTFHAPRAVLVDEVLLPHVFIALTGVKGEWHVREDSISRQLVFENSCEATPARAKLEWAEYVVGDLFGGTLTPDGNKVALPLLVSGGLATPGNDATQLQ